MRIGRFRFIFALRLTVLGSAICGFVAAAIEPANINFDYIRSLAKADAAAPYQVAANDLPPKLAALDYDDYRNIRFRPSQALWRDEKLPFILEFFHRGGLYRDKVTVREFSATHEQVVPFVRDFFSYDLTKDVGTLHSSLGYAGFRIHTPMNRPDVYDELIAFLGSSYFRAIGAGQLYGLSARGLAVNSGIVGTPEEFPRFTDFWVGKPEANDKAITIYALLKSPSVSGAFEYVVHPGKDTVIEVHSELTFRKEVELPGIAPLTSMFWYGENTERPPGQMRGEVHDSDGLLVLDTESGHLWHPLQNPADPEFSDANVRKLVRFGLLQRDRRMTSYEDLEAHYELRPSAWIEPVGDWGEGSVRLVLLPSGREYDDNIVAFWVPATKLPVQKPVQFNYRITWSLGEPSSEGLARVVNTHEGNLPGAAHGRLLWVDFADEQYATRDPLSLEADIDLGGNAHVRHRAIVPYPQIGGWRVAIECDAPSAGKSVSVKCQLRSHHQPISEIWSYEWKSS